MTAFEEALVAVMEQRVKTALAQMSVHSKLCVSDPREAMKALGDVHVALLKLGEDVRCLKRLHDMTEDLERKSA